MIGERENFNSETTYGSLVMRSYDIDGNEINAFYDSSDDLVFVLDNTVTSRKPNVLLVMNPDADKKWDEILSGDYGVDLETIRPKQDNKYQKLDIEYSGLSVYDSLIKAYEAGETLDESLSQLGILRDSAVRHSAMMRLNVANEIINKTNMTIVKTKESMVRLQARLKTLRAKLTEAKKGIGRVPTKQSAAKILKLESQIEATNEKLKRAQERLKSAQRRLETATVDAELASELLKQPDIEVRKPSKKSKKSAVIVAPRHEIAKTTKKLPVPVDEDEEDTYYEDNEDTEETDESDKENQTKENVVDDYEDDDFLSEEDIENNNFLNDEDDSEDKSDDVDEEEIEDDSDDKSEDVKPLFNEDPQILNNDIAFKPISFEAPVALEKSETSEKEDNIPALDRDMIFLNDEDKHEITAEDVPEETMDSDDDKDVKEKSMLESIRPIDSISEYNQIDEQKEIPETEEKTDVVVNDDSDYNDIDEDIKIEERPVLDTITPVSQPETTIETTDQKADDMITPSVPPVVPSVPPMPRVIPNTNIVNETTTKGSKPTFVYYLLLLILIVLAVFTLWLYQKNVKSSVPVLAASVENADSAEKTSFFKKKTKVKKGPVEEKVSVNNDVAEFLDDRPGENVPVKDTEVIESESIEPIEPTEPEILDDVPARVMTSGQIEEEEKNIASEDDILASKPIYEPGAKHKEMFVAEEYVEEISPDVYQNYQESEDIIEYVDEDDPFYDPEEEAYQAEQAELYYEE